MDIQTMKITWSVGELKQNTHIIVDEDGIIVVDAGCSPDRLKELYDKPIKAVLITHGHIDHIQCIKEYDQLDIPIYAGEHIVEMLADEENNVSKWYTPTRYDIKNLVLLKDNEEISIDKHLIKCYHTPGHTIDSVCYLLDNEVLFSGDTVFSVAVGRVDLPTGDKAELIRSLERILTIDFTYLYTGHGRVSNKEEQKTNIPKWINILESM